MNTVFALAAHADYRCRRTGVCCRAGWDVPVEAATLRGLRRAAAEGGLPLPAGAVVGEDDPPPGAAGVLGRGAGGACLLQDQASGLCRVHARLGPAALPAACRQFPRLVLRDDRGTFLTLSHFCPTAARALWRDRPLRVEAGPLPPSGDGYEGLDARGELPPLLHPRMLMDLDGYAAWEAHTLARLDAPGAPSAALDALRADAAALARWRPGGPTLRETLARLAPEAPPPPPAPVALYDEVRGAIDAALRPPAAAGVSGATDAPRFQAPVRRFLGAHAFASWCAYQGCGVRTIVRSLDAALAVLRVEAARLEAAAGHEADEALMVEAVRAADLRLRHQAGRQALADAWSAAERPAP